MTPGLIQPHHHAAILRNNARFVRWLWPLDAAELVELLDLADYAQQLHSGEAVLIGYDGHGPYRHMHVDWLAERLDTFFYIDRVIVGEAAQGQGLGRVLYDDVAAFARRHGHAALACEVNIEPNNPPSHAFHAAMGFQPLGETAKLDGTAVRFYSKKL